MERSEKTIVVAGVTGHQGGASARHLLADGWRVRGITRDPNTTKAHEMYEAGVELVVADLLDRASVDEAVRGAYGVHSVETPREAGTEGEEAEGRNLVDAAKAAGVEHFVYSSVVGADRDAGMPWVVSKHHLEGYLRESGLPWTVWRPSTFMENFHSQRDEILAGRLTGYKPPDAMHAYIAVDDIGKSVALSFRERDAWLGKATEIAGDRLRMTDLAETFTRVLGRPVTYERVSAKGMPGPKPDTTGEPPREADIAWLRTLVPGLRTVEDWLLEQKWALVAR